MVLDLECVSLRVLTYKNEAEIRLIKSALSPSACVVKAELFHYLAFRSLWTKTSLFSTKLLSIIRRSFIFNELEACFFIEVIESKPIRVVVPPIIAPYK